MTVELTRVPQASSEQMESKGKSQRIESVTDKS